MGRIIIFESDIVDLYTMCIIRYLCDPDSEAGSHYVSNVIWAHITEQSVANEKAASISAISAKWISIYTSSIIIWCCVDNYGRDRDRCLQIFRFCAKRRIRTRRKSYRVRGSGDSIEKWVSRDWNFPFRFLLCYFLLWIDAFFQRLSLFLFVT